MLFTREPIIETVITARNGYRLCVRNSKSPVEELLVDALEIVSFGQALFFRCVERPKAFLLPVSDYEVSEVRETRLVLKHMAQEGKKNSEPVVNRAPVKHEVRLEEAKSSEESSEGSEAKDSGASRSDRRRERRRQRRRRGDSRVESIASTESEAQEEDVEVEGGIEATPDAAETQESSSQTSQENVAENTHARRSSRSRGPMQLVSALIPPPPTLVSDLFRYEHLDSEGVRPGTEGNEEQIQNVRNEFVDTLQTRGDVSPLL